MPGIYIIPSGFMMHFGEFLVARHPLFKCKMRMSKVVGFGRTKVFHRARTSAIEFYTIISYYKQNKKHTAKISRGMGDEIAVDQYLWHKEGVVVKLWI